MFLSRRQTIRLTVFIKRVFAHDGNRTRAARKLKFEKTGQQAGFFYFFTEIARKNV